MALQARGHGQWDFEFPDFQLLAWHGKCFVLSDWAAF